MAGNWEHYDRWNAALAEVLFSYEMADLPAYVDVDDEVLAQVAAEIGGPASSAGKDLASVVRGTLGLDDRPLAGHMARHSTWRRHLTRVSADRRKHAATEVSPPPSLALLAVLVMAAQRMGADRNLAPNAYYPRLGEVLELSDAELKRLRTRFPQTEALWRGLNEYLEVHEGQRGLPTAYALAYRYVGIPQSQALVRAADRARLPEFFAQFGLTPGSELIPADLERMLEGWILQSPSPVTANLQRLWRGGSARERVSGVVSVELSLWDGTFKKGVEGATGSPGNVQLVAVMRQGFGRRVLELSFAARLPSPARAEELEIASAEGRPLISVTPAAGARLRPIAGSRLDGASLVGAVVSLREPQSNQCVERRPRRVVPLRRDELLGALVETDRVQLADDAVLLVKDDESLLGQVLELLRTYGHHGTLFRATETPGSQRLEGVPEGWVLIDDVQIYAIPQGVKRLDLHVLVPLTTAQLNFSGGLKLPGRIRKWSSLHPPELRAAVSEAEEMTIELRDLGSEDHTLLERRSEAGCAMAVPLSGLELEDGDYEVSLFVNGEKSPISQTTLRLRSADTPDVVTWETCARLNYETDLNPLAALSAMEDRGEASVIVDGLNTIGKLATMLEDVPVASGISWADKKNNARADVPAIVLGTADPKSCIVTGAHRIQLPTWHGGRPTSSQIVGVCSECGLRKTLPARPRWKKAGLDVKAQPEVRFATPPSHASFGVDLDSCLDALVHVGGGPVSALERVASQAQGGALFLDQYLRDLEAQGHIDVRRDEALRAVEWEANPAYLAETERNGFVLAGVWSQAARDALGAHLAARGGAVVRVSAVEDGLSSWFARGVTADALEFAVDELDLAATVVPDAARRMLDALPPLSDVEEEIPRSPIPSHTKAKIFDVVAADWMTVPGVGAPGAYRVEQSFKTVSLWLDDEGAVERTARVGSVQLVKHLAALHGRRPLLGYLEKASMLVVPMGADLPGLYGRAAVLCSGLPPLASRRTRSIAYRDVPRDVADRLNTLLVN